MFVNILIYISKAVIQVRESPSQMTTGGQTNAHSSYCNSYHQYSVENLRVDVKKSL